MRRGRLIGKRMMTRRRKLKNENAAFTDEGWMLDLLGRLERYYFALEQITRAISYIRRKGPLRDPVSHESGCNHESLKARSYSRSPTVLTTLSSRNEQSELTEWLARLLQQSRQKQHP